MELNFHMLMKSKTLTYLNFKIFQFVCAFSDYHVCTNLSKSLGFIRRNINGFNLSSCHLASHCHGYSINKYCGVILCIWMSVFCLDPYPRKDRTRLIKMLSNYRVKVFLLLFSIPGYPVCDYNIKVLNHFTRNIL